MSYIGYTKISKLDGWPLAWASPEHSENEKRKKKKSQFPVECETHTWTGSSTEDREE